jgi:hypothetical protein
MRTGGWPVLAALLAAAAGCIETEHDYTLNPNGSGKVVYTVITIPSQIGGTVQGESPDLAAKRSVLELLNQSRGVAGWRDVQFALRKDGRVWFKGTAYFDDLAALKLHLMKASEFTWQGDAAGHLVLEMREPGRRDAVLRPPAKLPPEEVARRIKAERARWHRTKQLMGHVIAAFRIGLRFRLPGRPTEVNGFDRDADGSLRLRFDGEPMFRAMDALVADDAFMAEAVRSGVDVLQARPGTNRTINERVFGLKGPARARLAPGPGGWRPLFDYDAEVRQARHDYPAMMHRLGLDQVPPVPPPVPARRP